MGAGSKILSQLSGDAVRWVESLSRKLGPPESKYSTPTDPEYLAEQMGMPLVGLDRHATQMFDIYDPKGLLSATREANYGESQLGLVPPSFFRKAATKLPTEDPIIREQIRKTIDELKDLRESRIGLDDVPYLSYDLPMDKDYIDIVGHEGRHRSRALEELGEPEQLVRFIPKGRSNQVLSGMDPKTIVKQQITNSLEPRRTAGALSDIIRFLDHSYDAE